MRLMYGSPNATTFGLWDFWAGSASGDYTAATLYDANWNLTAVGQAYESLIQQWTTDVHTTIGASGTADLTGTFGDYDVIIGDKTFSMTFDGSNPTLTVVTPEPATFPLLLLSLTLLHGRFLRHRNAERAADLRYSLGQ